MSGWAAAAQVVGQVGGQLIANAGNARQNRKNRELSRELMDVQYKNQRQLNEQGQQLQQKTWDDTNYGAQVEHMKKAGLNVGLMYGMSGGGGATTGSQGGGSAAAGQVPSSIPMQAPNMDITNIMARNAEIELMKANAEKLKAEADSIRGGEGTVGQTQIAEGQSRIDKLKAETTNEELKQLLTKAQTQTETQRSGLVMQEAIATAEKVVQLSRENSIGNETYDAAVSEILGRAAGVEITNRLNEARIKLTEQQDKQLEEAIAQKWEEISLHDTEVNIKIAQTIINGIGTIGGLLQASRLAEAMKQAKGKINKKTEKTITGDGKDVWKETTYE